jgi:aryl sulfotransferase
MTDSTQWPAKTRELAHSHFDSTFWNDFPFRDDDIVVATYAKSGTTWVQQILSQLIFNGAEGINVAEQALWVDFRLPPQDVMRQMLEAQTHRRFIKTHLPVDALVYSPKAKYLYIARDGRDVLWSYYNHHSNHTDEIIAALNSMIPPDRPDIEPLKPADLEIHDYFRRWLERDGYPIWSLWENVSAWWAIRDLPNMMLLHFSQLKADMPGQVRKIAEFLEIPIDESKWEAILEHCSFDYMKEHAANSVPLGGTPWKGGAKTFIHKGTNGRWRDVLTDEDNARYEATAVEKLGPECAHWLKTGEMP